MGSFTLTFWKDRRCCDVAGCQRRAVYPTALCKKHKELPSEIIAEAQAALAEIKPLTEIRERFNKAYWGNPEDMRTALAWIEAYREELVDRAESNDLPETRAKALVALKMGDPEKAMEILQKGVDYDVALRRLAEFSKTQLDAQSRAAEIRLRSENSMTPRQTMILLQGTIQVVAQICGAHQAQRVVAEIYKGLLNREPKLALTGIQISSENNNA